MSTKKTAVLKKVKATLLEGLKKDGLMWFKPWKAGMNFPINNKSGRAYRGFNNFILNAQMQEKEYKYNEWVVKSTRENQVQIYTFG